MIAKHFTYDKICIKNRVGKQTYHYGQSMSIFTLHKSVDVDTKYLKPKISINSYFNVIPMCDVS